MERRAKLRSIGTLLATVVLSACAPDFGLRIDESPANPEDAGVARDASNLMDNPLDADADVSREAPMSGDGSMPMDAGADAACTSAACLSSCRELISEVLAGEDFESGLQRTFFNYRGAAEIVDGFLVFDREIDANYLATDSLYGDAIACAELRVTSRPNPDNLDDVFGLGIRGHNSGPTAWLNMTTGRVEMTFLRETGTYVVDLDTLDGVAGSSESLRIRLLFERSGDEYRADFVLLDGERGVASTSIATTGEEPAGRLGMLTVDMVSLVEVDEIWIGR